MTRFVELLIENKELRARLAAARAEAVREFAEWVGDNPNRDEHGVAMPETVEDMADRYLAQAEKEQSNG